MTFYINPPPHLTNAPPDSKLIAWCREDDIASYETPDGNVLVIDGVRYADVMATQLVVAFARECVSLRRRMIRDYMANAKPIRSEA